MSLTIMSLHFNQSLFKAALIVKINKQCWEHHYTESKLSLLSVKMFTQSSKKAKTKETEEFPKTI